MVLISDLICWYSPGSDQRTRTDDRCPSKMGPVFAYDTVETSETIFYLWLTTGHVKRRGRSLMVMSNGYRTLSQHLNDLKKENFSLKLRIYFLEERIQQKYEESSEDVYRTVSQSTTVSESCPSGAEGRFGRECVGVAAVGVPHSRVCLPPPCVFIDPAVLRWWDVSCVCFTEYLLFFQQAWTLPSSLPLSLWSVWAAHTVAVLRSQLSVKWCIYTVWCGGLFCKQNPTKNPEFCKCHQLKKNLYTHLNHKWLSGIILTAAVMHTYLF